MKDALVPGALIKQGSESWGVGEKVRDDGRGKSV